MVIKPAEINRLKTLVEKQLGFSISHRPDCERLSLEIFQRTGQVISYNTIRRFYGLAGSKNSSKPTITTLNILANYCGFKNFYQIALGEENIDLTIEDVYNNLISFQQKGCINPDDFMSLFNNLEQNTNYYLFFYEIIALSFRLRDKRFILNLFDLNDIYVGKNYLHIHIYFAMISLGLQMRKREDKKAIWRHWAKLPNAQSFYFELFVDMDYLIIDHYYALNEYRKHKSTPESSLFASSLLFLRSFMVGNKSQMAKEIQNLNSIPLTEEIHPIPIARYLTAKILYEKEKYGEVTTQTKKQVSYYIHNISIYGVVGKYTSFFHIWMMEGLVLAKEYNLALDLIYNAEKHGKEVISYYNKGSWERYKIYKAFTLLHHGNQMAASSLFSRINQKQFHPFSAQYDSIFFQVLDYKLNKNQAALKRAKSTARLLKYDRLINLLVS